MLVVNVICYYPILSLVNRFTTQGIKHSDSICSRILPCRCITIVKHSVMNWRPKFHYNSIIVTLKCLTVCVLLHYFNLNIGFSAIYWIILVFKFKTMFHLINNIFAYINFQTRKDLLNEILLITTIIEDLHCFNSKMNQCNEFIW